jgi:hypothetical protein
MLQAPTSPQVTSSDKAKSHTKLHNFTVDGDRSGADLNFSQCGHLEAILSR